MKICDKSFVSKYDLRRHRKKHEKNINPIQCDQCEYETGDKGALKVHLESILMGVRHLCDICDFSSDTRSGLNKHRKQVH